jgi:hypothetical protein
LNHHTQQANEQAKACTEDESDNPAPAHSDDGRAEVERENGLPRGRTPSLAHEADKNLDVLNGGRPRIR